MMYFINVENIQPEKYTEHTDVALSKYSPWLIYLIGNYYWIVYFASVSSSSYYSTYIRTFIYFVILKEKSLQWEFLNVIGQFQHETRNYFNDVMALLLVPDLLEHVYSAVADAVAAGVFLRITRNAIPLRFLYFYQINPVVKAREFIFIFKRKNK